MDRCRCKNGQQKDVCSKQMRLHAQTLLIVQDLMSQHFTFHFYINFGGWGRGDPCDLLMTYQWTLDKSWHLKISSKPLWARYWLPQIHLRLNTKSQPRECTYYKIARYKKQSSNAPLLRTTSHTRLRARDHYTSSTLIGGKGGAGPSSFHTMLEGPTEYVNSRWM